ncbi:uncharacterized protein LOC143591869 [Bidens hawaiensis]|uniref:uncharacterized protein LOC143591869 n=1 Tax=Bidens hawaiensis TaxID=980011 RepID=UPI00404AAC3A
MANLNEFEANDAPDDHVNVYKGISIAYLDYGDQNFMCGMCNALLWEVERKRGKTNNGITTYSLCCSYGDVQLPEMKSAPVDNSVNKGNALKLGGENYHSLGSLLPMSGQNPRFSQLYIYDTENEISNRRLIFRDTESNSEVLDNQIINYLEDMLDSKNPLVKNARTYNLPTTFEVAALIVGDIGEEIDKRDIIVTTQSGALQRISELHPCYVPLQYPIFFHMVKMNETSIDSNGFLVYRRRDLGSVVVKSAGSVKYLFKYINKGGPDRALYHLYLSACEAAWRILDFDVHYRVPYVTRLPFHLPGQQTVVFADDDDVEDILNKPSVGSSKFIAWMECNQQYDLARTLTYAEFPTKFVWKPDERVWGLRKQDIRTVDGEVCATYRDACYKRGLLDGDNEYIEAIEEASHTASDLVLSETQLKNLALLEIENFLPRNNCTLRCFPTMPFYDDDSILASTNHFMNEELAYDTEVMTGEFERIFRSLTDEHGIASLLLEGGRTAHSRFLIPINLNEDSTCSIKRNPDICNLINKTDLIIWDEAPMIHKHAFEALDRTLKDVIKDGNRSNCEHPFGGKVIVFGGNFRQILHVVQNRSRSDIVNASLSLSHIWTKCKVLRLTKTMRLTVGCQSSNLEDTIRFAKWLLELGEGKLGGDNDGNVIIKIPDDLLIRDSADPLSDLIDFVYPSLLEKCNDILYFHERAILAPLNEVVEEINDKFLSMFPGEEVEYLSSDSLDNSESVGPGFDQALHSSYFLNGLKFSE